MSVSLRKKTGKTKVVIPVEKNLLGFSNKESWFQALSHKLCTNTLSSIPQDNPTI